MHETEEKKQRFILAAAAADDAEIDADRSLDELAELLATAGGEEAGRIVQKREAPHVKTYLGSGKIEELKSAVELTHADGVITDDELTPAQLKALTDCLGVKVIDRTLLILDIFSQRAATREGKLQVEMAQLSYRLSRLAGLDTELSRQGGSVGGAVHSRGAGESKLELTRRQIRERMDHLRDELREIAGNRRTGRAMREKENVPVVALVGYTNAGKSTLFNRLTAAGVLEEDQLFATLDTTTRKCVLPSGRVILLTDTVGFIHKLPHQLVKAFQSTLEEAAYADLLLHVVDASDPKAAMEVEVTRRALAELGAADTDCLLLLNKQDRIDTENILAFHDKDEKTLRISAFSEADRAHVLSAIDEALSQGEHEYEVIIPYSAGHLVHMLNEKGKILAQQYRAEGTYLKVRSKKEYENRVKEYVCSPNG